MTRPFDELRNLGPGELGPVDLDALRRIRGEDGRFAVGLPGPRLKTGLRSRLLEEQPQVVRAHREKCRAITADLGNPIATLKADAVREAARVSLIVESLGEDVFRRGPLTAKGQKRAAVTCYLDLLDRFLALMRALGLERRQPSVPTLDEYLEHRRQSASGLSARAPAEADASQGDSSTKAISAPAH